MRTGLHALGLGLAAALCLALALACAAPLTAALAAEGAAPAVDDLVTVGIAALGLALSLWYAASAVIHLVGLLTPGRLGSALLLAVAHVGAPGLRAAARRMLTVGAGAGLAAGLWLGPASAQIPEPGPTVSVTLGVSDAPPDLTLGADPPPAAPPSDGPEHATAQPQAPETVPPTPAATESAPADPVAAPDPAPADGSETSTRGDGPAAAAPTQADHVRVRAGDSLWALARTDLAGRGLPTSDADIAAAWPDWYRLNHDAIGADPDLIHPGQVLAVPSTEHQEQ